MRKIMVPIVLVTLLALPSTVLAKGVEGPIKKVKGHGVEKSYQSQPMNAMWSRFNFDIDQIDDNGKILNDNNPVFDYVLADWKEDIDLDKEDSVLINVINRGGNIVKQLNYSLEDQEIVDDVDEDDDDDVDDVDETAEVRLYTTSQELDETYGAVRLLNFNNLASGAEVYLTDAQEKLGTIDRTLINFYRGTTTEGETPYGDWEERNTVRFGYDSEDGKVWVELDAEYEYRAEYATDEDVDFNAIQFMLLNRESDSVVKLENIMLNGKEIGDREIVLVGDSDWPKWNLVGDLQKSNGDFTLEADLVITGDQPKGEINKLEIMFGNR